MMLSIEQRYLENYVTLISRAKCTKLLNPYIKIKVFRGDSTIYIRTGSLLSAGSSKAVLYPPYYLIYLSTTSLLLYRVSELASESTTTP